MLRKHGGNKVTITKIERDRMEAPFVGHLISGYKCSINCPNCFNQHLKDSKRFVWSANKIIQGVIMNAFADGIILGGLEWSEQPEEAMRLITTAQDNGLHVMVYTGLDDLDEFKRRIPARNIWVKYGSYKEDENAKTEGHITLASSNQAITFIT